MQESENIIIKKWPKIAKVMGFYSVDAKDHAIFDENSNMILLNQLITKSNHAINGKYAFVLKMSQ